MDTKRAEFIAQFQEEVDTQLLLLSQGLVALERDPSNVPLLKDVFRAAHTIKGAARMLGFVEISRVTHELESVLHEMREGRLIQTPEITDVLIEAMDVVDRLTKAESHPGGAEQMPAAELAALVSRLHEIAQPTPPDAGGADTLSDLPLSDDEPHNGHGPAASRPDLSTGAAVAEGSTGAGSIQSFLDDTVRVQVQKLDTLMNLAGEMVISKMQNETIAARLQEVLEVLRGRQRILTTLDDSVAHGWGTLSQQDLEGTLARLRTMDHALDQIATTTLRDFQTYAAHISNVADELQDTVFSVRMLPVESLFVAFPRAVRDMARESSKQIDLVMRGGETELDKKIMEALYEPLVHLLRNAVDHGIEASEARVRAGKSPVGRVTIRAFQQAGQVGIEVTDDGKGIDADALRRVALQKGLLTPAQADALSDEEMLLWIYQPGFTTAHMITDVSGRGVGMDIVKTTVERLNGTVQVASRPGEGTTISLRVPLTLATTQGLLVRVGSQVFALPSHTVERMEYIGAEDLFTLEGREVVRLREHTMPVARLEELLDLERVGPLHYQITAANAAGSELGATIHLENKLPGILVGESDRQICLLVDALIDERVIVVKSLGPLLSGIATQAGATMLGNGQVVVILDVPNLVTEARARSSRGLLAGAWPVATLAHQHHILVVDDSITTRELEKSILENAGYEVEVAMDGREALHRLERDPSRFDMAIVDIEMPQMDGLELTQRIKAHSDERLRRLPVIIVSSLASDAYKRRGAEVGAQAYITKGQFEQSRLLETIELLIH